MVIHRSWPFTEYPLNVKNPPLPESKVCSELYEVQRDLVAQIPDILVTSLVGMITGDRTRQRLLCHRQRDRRLTIRFIIVFNELIEDIDIESFPWTGKKSISRGKEIDGVLYDHVDIIGDYATVNVDIKNTVLYFYNMEYTSSESKKKLEVIEVLTPPATDVQKPS